MGQVLQNYGWSDEKVINFRADLLSWYDQNKRDLPWRKDNNPYYIWVSEIMLQQTQVATVIPYFERFIKALPTIADLASVEDEKLMSLWQGLGYYSRARNLKLAAQQIMRDFNGRMPNQLTQIASLKGIGPYTAGAIASMAFNLPEPAIDGNLMRVTARIFELDHDIAKASSRKVFAAILQELIDPERPGDFNQAMMDLGATIMTPTNYYPENNPVKAYDASFINETAEHYPVKSKKTKATHHYFYAYIIENEHGQIALRQHEAGQLLSDLWHYPLAEVPEFYQDDHYIIERLMHHFPILENASSLVVNQRKFEQLELLPTLKHVFSHRVWHVQLIPIKIVGFSDKDLEKSLNLRFEGKDHHLPISSLQKKLQERYEEVDN